MVLDLPGGLFGQDDVRETVITPTGTNYASISGTGFIPEQPDTQDVTYANSQATPSTGTVIFYGSIQIPHGAVVTSATVIGSFAETWTLVRKLDSAGTQTMASGSGAGSTDTSISFATIDNQNNSYLFKITNIDQADGDYIRLAIVTYTI